jgi:SSS family solute:Na+ symporter
MILETDLPALVVGFFCAGALSASMSTGDALLHAAASVTVEDGLGSVMKLSEERQRALMRILVLVMGTVAYAFALDEDSSLVTLLLTSYGIICQLAPTAVSALYWKRATTPGVVTGLLAGGATAIFFFAFPDFRPFGVHEGILGLLVHIPVLVAVSLRTPRQEALHAAAFVDLGYPETEDASVGHGRTRG